LNFLFGDVEIKPKKISQYEACYQHQRIEHELRLARQHPASPGNSTADFKGDTLGYHILFTPMAWSMGIGRRCFLLVNVRLVLIALLKSGSGKFETPPRINCYLIEKYDLGDVCESVHLPITWFTLSDFAMQSDTIKKLFLSDFLLPGIAYSPA